MKNILFTINLIDTEGKLVYVITSKHRVQISVTESDALDLFSGEVAGAPCNLESPFRRSVNKVRGCAEIVGEIGIGFDCLKRSWVPR